MREWRYKLHAFLTSALDGGEWSDPLPNLFIPGKALPVPPWIGGWVGPRAGLNTVAKRKKSLLCPYWESKLGRPAHNLITILTEQPQFLILTMKIKTRFSGKSCVLLFIYINKKLYIIMQMTLCQILLVLISVSL
jgi:hypothetical protein